MPYMKERAYNAGGGRLYSLTNRGLKSFCLALYIRAGSIFEDKSDNGISHLFEHLVFRNLKNKYDNFYELLALHGIDMQGCTYKEFIRFSLTGPYYEFNFAAEILIHLFDEIKLNAKELSNEKKRIKAEIREQDERNTIDYYFNKLVWKDSGAQKTELGYCRILDGVSVRKINDFKRKALSDGNWFVYVTGNAGDGDIEKLRDNLSALKCEKVTEPRVNNVGLCDEFFNRKLAVKVMNGSWTYVKIGFDVDCTKYPAGVYDLLYAVLFTGEKSLLNSFLSEDNPIVYSYNSAFEQYDNAGNINFRFEADRKNLEQAMQATVDMLTALKEGRFNFEASLRYEMSTAETELDNPDDLNWSMAYCNHILDCQKLDYSDPYYGKFNVTKEQIVAAARDIFRLHNMTAAVRGNKNRIDIKKSEDILRRLE